ncbi:flagellar filament capping protein FliD [Massilia niastensis]|uniref:flagellar filament capping protein FliD n=1 Tax=Massilia niastensis TaxID=544911 RepID=UPI0003808A60|nr:flagellar filament capping protein FliD [Massilia niastensis]
MASPITAPTYDPRSTAASLARSYVLAREQLLEFQGDQSVATGQALGELNSAMLAFQTSLGALTGLNKTLFAQTASFSDTTLGSATASASATAGSYAFFVKQVATASQVSYTGLTDNAGVGGNLAIRMGGAAAFNVNLSAADSDGNGTLSTRELAAAINGAAGNDAKVTASIVTTGGTSELVLTAKNTGANTAITIDTSAVTGPSSLAAANADPARVRTLVAAQDAEIRVGSETGTAIVQASNTFTNIDGVKMTFTKAQASGSAPLTVTVGADLEATTANVQAFVDAYNKLKTTLNKLTEAGDPAKNVAGGAFAHDSGIRALNARLVGLLRPVSGDTLAAYGIIATREGTLELRTDRLKSQLAAEPGGLDALIGSASSSSPTGIAGALEKYLKSWSNGVDGQIKQRKDAASSQQSRVEDRLVALKKEEEAAYGRYLRQFTQLQTVQGMMNQHSSLFDSLFGNKD